jgi:hypothetical protein
MSIEAMKQAVATIDKIIDGCNNVQEEKDIHGDAKTLAKLIKKDCFPTLEALCQAIAEAEKQKFECLRCGHCCRVVVQKAEWVGLTDEDIDLYGLDEGVTDNKAPAWLVTYARGIEAKLKEKNT